MTERGRKKRKNRLIVRGILIAVLTGVLVTLILLIVKLNGTSGRAESSASAESAASQPVSSASAESAASRPDSSGASESGTGDSSASGQSVSESSASRLSASESSASAVSTASGTVTLSESQKVTGDLILVNYEHSYDFEANASLINLVSIQEAQSFSYPVAKAEFQLSSHVMAPLDAMIKACNEAMGTEVTGIESAYRTKEYQQQVWDEAVQEYGESYAEKYVAVPGFSEHHTGLAVDLGIIEADGTEESFSESPNAVWMEENCSRFGFVRRYAEDKVSVTKVNNEAWHFRYVGIPHAVYMTQQNLCLEEYLEFLKSSTSAENPLTVSCDAGSFHIWYTAESTIEKPSGSYEVSGNNSDGWIITEKA